MNTFALPRVGPDGPNQATVRPVNVKVAVAPVSFVQRALRPA
jgi:hypothetical protein